MATVQEALDQIWSDEGLKKQLISDPKPVLKSFGLELPEDVSVEVHENTANTINAVLPLQSDGFPVGDDAIGQTIQRAWSDAEFKEKLLSDPKEAVAEMGVRLPEDVDLKIWVNTPTVQHMVLPANPAQSELSEFDLVAVAGGPGPKTGSGGPGGCQGSFVGFVNNTGSGGGKGGK